MDLGAISAFRDVDDAQFVECFNNAQRAVWRAQFSEADDRWAGAAEAVCGLLRFVIESEPLWFALHGAIDGLESAQGEIHEVRERLHEFIPVEYALLVRRGVDDGAAGEIVRNVVNGLHTFDNATHEEVAETRSALSALRDSLCTGVDDWAVFAEPELRALHHVQSLAVVGGTGATLAVVTNALSPIFPIFVVGSIAGGIAGAISCFMGFRRRK